MPLIPILKGYKLDKGSTMKPKGEDTIELKFTNVEGRLLLNVFLPKLIF